MSVLILIVALIVSFFAIIKSADYFVDGAASLAKRLRVSTFVIGVSVIAVGTSAPELFVNATAAFVGATQLSIGNVLGSNLINILLGLGVASIFRPLVVHSRTVWKEFPFMLLSSVVLLLLGAGNLLGQYGDNVISRSDSLILLSFFVIFMVYTFGIGADQSEHSNIQSFSIIKSILLTVAGIVGLVAFSKVLVWSATSLSSILGISQNLIGLTVIAIGTSLPEIVTSVSAVRKGLIDLIVGGMVGSNIFNVFLILGVTAFINPIEFSYDNVVDTFTLSAVSMILFMIMFVGKRHTLQSSQGATFVLLYILYIIFAVLRG